jgi:hypothetical protein
MVIRRLTFTNLPNGDVRQHGELMLNKQTPLKTEYEFIYKRKPTTDESTFLSLLDTMEARYNEKNYIGVANFYDDDSEIIGGNTYEKGRMAIDNYWYNIGMKYGGSWELQSHWVKINSESSTATQRGTSTLAAANGSKSVVEFILNWKKTMQGWKIVQDIYW